MTRSRIKVTIHNSGIRTTVCIIYFKNKIPSLEDLLKTLADLIRFNFIPTITDGYLCSNNDRILLSFSVRFSGLAIPLLHNDAKHEYENTTNLTLPLKELIKDQYQIYSVKETE